MGLALAFNCVKDTWHCDSNPINQAARFTLLKVSGFNKYSMYIMETKVTKAILVLAVMLLFLVGQSSAGYIDCYHHCYAACRANGTERWACRYTCALECLSLPPPAFPPLPPKLESNCGSACAMSSCGHLDPEGKDTEACIDTCWKNCSILRHNSP